MCCTDHDFLLKVPIDHRRGQQEVIGVGGQGVSQQERNHAPNGHTIVNTASASEEHNNDFDWANEAAFQPDSVNGHPSNLNVSFQCQLF